ncbi:response regulator transcription factor [Streptomyces phaeochromogenes]|uniref:response regulator transcription factor n=1 Tax=Streptomyces phaeochromogenes TaxID=1923 RepID=UPI003F5EC971
MLVAEDDVQQAERIRDYLERAGCRVAVVHDGGAAIAAVRESRPDLLVLDLMLPGTDGLEVARAVRRESTLPIVMVTARTEETDQLRGFKRGADDYITKPYSPKVLVARIMALLHRSASAGGYDHESDSRILRVGSLVVDRDRRKVTVAGRVVACTRGEWRILEGMAAAPGRPFTRQRLLDLLFDQDPEHLVTLRTVDTHVFNLRKKIEDHPDGIPRRLLTVHGVGYKLVEGRRAA